MKRKAKYAWRPALADATVKDKGIAVSRQRYRWKLKNDSPTEKMIRMVRFVWMRRSLPWNERHALHGWVLGACMKAGLIARSADMRLVYVTKDGANLLDIDRRRHGEAARRAAVH